MAPPSIVWLRQDLRLEDNPALHAATLKGGAVILLFVWAPEEENGWKPGAASRWWLHQALTRLQKECNALGLQLILRQYSSFQAMVDIAKQTGADAIFWNRRYEPYAIKQENFIHREIRKLGIQTQDFNGSLLFEPGEILNKQQKPYQIFTHFWNFCCRLEEPLIPLCKPRAILPYQENIQSDLLEHLNLLPDISWDKGLYERWPQSVTSQDYLQDVIEKIIAHYNQTREIFVEEGTSSLSPYLHMGEISPRMVWSAVQEKFGRGMHAEAFLRQLVWREFAYYLLFHFPHISNHPLRTIFDKMPWEKDSCALFAWQKGMTGYPIVDAGMRQLWHTGWMHNRARMIAGSFLVKDLLIDWREGARWFWDTLVDADLANNSLGWQWLAGCGVDAAPYFRIFNPVIQGEKFDAQGDYVRRWIPELRQLPNKWIHHPWEAPSSVLKAAEIELGKNYPWPIIDHREARERVLRVYNNIRK